MATIEQLLVRIETELYLAAGLDVQTHAEDPIINLIRKYYNIYFDKFWWDNTIVQETMTLDGTTGKVTIDLSEKILRHNDIYSIYYSTGPKPLPKRSLAVNPAIATRICYGPESDATKVFKIYPITTVGDVHLFYRTRIADSVWESITTITEINMDDELLVSSVCADYISTEGSNPDEVTKHQRMAADRLKTLTRLELDGGFSKTSQANNIPTEWNN